MSRGTFEYQWSPFVDALKHTINSENLVCMTRSGNLHLCRFENEQFIDVDNNPIACVVLYQNNSQLANSMRGVIDYMSKLDKK